MKNLFLVLGLFFAGLTLAHAHAFLDSAEPAVGSTVQASPTVVKIWFTKKIERDGSNIQVFGAKGAEVDGKDVRLDPGDGFLLSVSVGTLPPGPYKVVWNAICLDTHHTTGTFTFTVISR